MTVLCKNWYLLGRKKFQAMLTKQYLFVLVRRVLFKISNEHPCLFDMGVSPSVSLGSPRVPLTCRICG